MLMCGSWALLYLFAPQWPRHSLISRPWRHHWTSYSAPLISAFCLDSSSRYHWSKTSGRKPRRRQLTPSPTPTSPLGHRLVVWSPFLPKVIVPNRTFLICPVHTPYFVTFLLCFEIQSGYLAWVVNKFPPSSFLSGVWVLQAWISRPTWLLTGPVSVQIPSSRLFCPRAATAPCSCYLWIPSSLLLSLNFSVNCALVSYSPLAVLSLYDRSPQLVQFHCLNKYEVVLIWLPASSKQARKLGWCLLSIGTHYSHFSSRQPTSGSNQSEGCTQTSSGWQWQSHRAPQLQASPTKLIAAPSCFPPWEPLIKGRQLASQINLLWQ